MKIRISIFCFLLIFCFFCNYAFASSYKEISTSQGKVIIGLDEREALERFGVPAAVSDDVWSYSLPEEFFIYFPDPLSINLYPKFCKTSTGVPLELKAFICFPNFTIKDITGEIELLISEPRSFIVKETGVIIPKKDGRYQILGKYKNIFSEPVYVNVQEFRISEKEKLISIDILPYKPEIPRGSRLNFTALGTFLDYSDNKYFIRDITRKALWFLQQNKDIKKVKDNEIIFSAPGAFKVFCKYKELESFPREVQVYSNMPLPLRQTLKHIILLPDFVIASVGNNIALRAFGTYYNNRVDDITSKVDWSIKERGILEIKGNGYFNPKSEGVTEVSARLEHKKSLSAKIIVSAEDKYQRGIVSELHTLKELEHDYKHDYIHVYKDLIKNDVYELSKNILGGKKALKLIRITPEYLSIPLGHEGEFIATAVYNDNSEENLTKIGKWMSSDNKIATISLGTVSGLAVGQCGVYMEFRGVKSLPAMLTVEGPKLVSIILSPQNSEVSMADNLRLKAEGYFSDSSYKDITDSVTWNIKDRRIIKIDRGSVKPLKFGQTNVYAEYLKIKSLPVDIKVIITAGWVFWAVLKTILFLNLAIIITFFIFYIMTIRTKKKLISRYKDPEGFIILLYENAKKILDIFGLKDEKTIAPLSYAESIEKKLSVENKVFLKFTSKFEEAKYSQHILQSEDACVALNEYNNLIRILLGRYNKFSLFFRYCLTLLNRKPLFLII